MISAKIFILRALKKAGVKLVEAMIIDWLVMRGLVFFADLLADSSSGKYKSFTHDLRNQIRKALSYPELPGNHQGAGVIEQQDAG